MKKLARPHIKMKQSDQKPKLLSELMGKDQEAFERFVQEKTRLLSAMEKSSNDRVQLVRKARNQARLPAFHKRVESCTVSPTL